MPASVHYFLQPMQNNLGTAVLPLLAGCLESGSQQVWIPVLRFLPYGRNHGCAGSEVRMEKIKLWVNDHEIEAASTDTVIEAAERVGITIPRLCSHPLLKPSGSCRLCAVEIEGYRGLPAACSTPVKPSMRVLTDTPRVLDFRREMLWSILLHHPRECLGCSRNGTCELQRLVETIGIAFPYPAPEVDRPPAQPAGRYFERDYSLCVSCGRCVRVCHEVRGAGAVVFRDMGGQQRVGTPLGLSLEEAGCQFCGACVDVCPVGALRETRQIPEDDFLELMQADCEKFGPILKDLFGKGLKRSWKRSNCPICTAGCSLSFETAPDGKILQVRPERSSSENRGQACVQGRFLLKHYLQRPDRLTKPLVLQHGEYRREEWGSVLDRLAAAFQACRPWEAAVLADARMSTEDLYLLQKFARTALKTGLVGCLSPAGCAATERFRGRLSKRCATDSDLNGLTRSACILSLGFNPPASQPVAGTILREAVLAGSKLVAAHPCSVSLSRYADIFLQYIPGTEAFLLAGIVRAVLDEMPEGANFSVQHPAIVDALKRDLEACNPEQAARVAGVLPESLFETARLLVSCKPLSILLGPALAESPHACQWMDALTTLLRITGNGEESGGGIFPLYGHGNLRGASDLGMLSDLYEFSSPEREYDPTRFKDLKETLVTGGVKVLYITLQSMESRLYELLRPILDGIDLVVLHDLVSPITGGDFAPRPADVVLPMASVLENGGTFVYADGKTKDIAPVAQPPGEARSVQWVFQELAQRMKIPGFRFKNNGELAAEIRTHLGTATARQSYKPETAHPKPCCTVGKLRSDATCPEALLEWKPPPIPTSLDASGSGFPYVAVLKEDLGSYFLGPLLAEETKRTFHTSGEIEMNPSDAFSLGFHPGEVLRIASTEGEWEGRLAMNNFVASGTIAVSSRSHPLFSRLCRAEGRCVAVRVEKIG